MSYLSRVTGRIQITPPLPWSAIQDSKFLPSRTALGDAAVRYDIRETETNTNDGKTTVIVATGVLAGIGGQQFKAYSLRDDLNEIGKEITAAGSTWAGALVRVGEDVGDIERFRVGALGLIVQERALLRWPDGSEVEA
jgi:hypothetical protein